ncbi:MULTISPECIES: response regulator transcription factor [Dyadobacter]|uniref:Response regulator transcription factor n=1 Tax=Dyadobacter chenhuakuii TaxID=2909339 RepID=A0A9X1TSF9_9BACT|nr:MULTISPECIES: response regulator transcription factor [Dyadobacter]MCF2492713.1 response regulator transcription factor [Dyadobacter chenhuakuii]MCF2496882.1 response regulator transcription factor [Dyadobacter chenhuakuii]MCF2520775.1 response regulator transcription factor [Dyadobacter sp. CY351]USJ32996.1 response regulator transcription factor [Dyadobacter chenhuakuii]
MKTILLVEDHSIVRMGVKLLIEDVIPAVVIIEAASFSETLRVLQTRHFDLVILDIRIPGGEAFNMIPRIRAVQENVKILVFSSQEEELYALHYVKAGANGFLPKDTSNEELERAVSSVLNGGTYISNVVQQQLVNNTLVDRESRESPLEILSNRELEIMDMLLTGKWTKDIAIELNIKESTVSTYKARIFEKLEVTNVLELFKKVEIYKKHNSGFHHS